MDILSPLLSAQDALARLEASAEAALPEVREGLLARLAFREASGWLAHHGTWIHPVDLSLRDAGVTGSYGAADLGMRLPSVLPLTTASAPPEDPPEDRDVAAALAHARQWRRLAESRGWTPEGATLPTGDEPALLAAVQLLSEAPEEGRGDRLSSASALRAAWVWRERGGTGHPGLLVFSAPIQQLHRLALAPRATLIPGLLEAIAEAARQARRELNRLNAAAIRGAALKSTARARLPEAVAEALRRPVLTARMLAGSLRISARAAHDAIDRMEAAGLLREATGRSSWRAFVIAERR